MLIQFVFILSFGGMQMLPLEGGGGGTTQSEGQSLPVADPAHAGAPGFLQPISQASMHVLSPSGDLQNDVSRPVSGLGADWSPQV